MVFSCFSFDVLSSVMISDECSIVDCHRYIDDALCILAHTISFSFRSVLTRSSASSFVGSVV